MSDGVERGTSEISPFDIRDPLPVGTTLLEASAGTGKTWTIAALVARFVAEGEARLDEMLVVTFGRAASQELRERVREQLVELEQAYLDPAAERDPNEVVDLLLDADPAECARRQRRVREALSEFDGATIATTHQFCQLVLRSLGVAGDTDSGATLVDDLDELLLEVVDDLYLRGFAASEQKPLFSRAEALQLARAVVGDPQARLEPAADDPGSSAGRRVGFAEAVRKELARRKRRLGVLGYDDLLSQLADALDKADAPARARMRQRWRVVLVDEFQDTDPVQWQVLDRAFSGHARMVLIGDPKQAIYAFRGGDVVTYLAAAATATQRRTLATNWRSDQPLLDQVQALFRGAALGDADILVHPVEAAHAESRLSGAPEGEPFTVRVLTRKMLGKNERKPLAVGDARPVIARDCALQIKALLTSGATVDGRPIRAGDVAVLAHASAQLRLVHDALSEIGVPAVIAGGGSVFTTRAAREWLTVLEAMEQPHRSSRVRAAALTPFLGHSAEQIDAEPDLTDELSEMFVDWARLFAHRGAAAVLEAASLRGLHQRVLGWHDGERHLTDVRHVGEVLHQRVTAERLGLVAVVQWLREQMADEARTVGTERTRRLDSDVAAVQLVTIHGSKGLQYPIVHLPFVADRFVHKPDLALFHDATDQHRCLDVGGETGSRWRDSCERHLAEEAGESLRLLYVAMTRAKSQLVCWWAPTRNTADSALHRMMVGRRPGETVVPDKTVLPGDDQVHGSFETWRTHGGPVWRLATTQTPVPELQEEPTPQLSIRTFDRSIDTEWRRTSYTGLSKAAEGAATSSGVASEPEQPLRGDEPDSAEVPAENPGEAGVPAAARVPSPMAQLPLGAGFGSLVHAVLEHADPEAPDFTAELATQVAQQLPQWPAPVTPEELAPALAAVCASPLGPLANDVTLAEIPLRRRLRELEFELPLHGGDDHRGDVGDVVLAQIAPLLRAHLPAGDPLLPYAEALADPALGGQRLRGYLTGSIDVVLEVDGRFLVVDYKTNWLGQPDADLTAADYAPAALAAAMGHSDYPLQALLYAVVLHRYLRWRLPGYDPEHHLGGVLYLYLRGMCGPDTPVIDGHPTGVFSWRPPVALVHALSDLLDGEGATP